MKLVTLAVGRGRDDELGLRPCRESPNEKPPNRRRIGESDEPLAQRLRKCCRAQNVEQSARRCDPLARSSQRSHPRDDLFLRAATDHREGDTLFDERAQRLDEVLYRT